MLRLIGLVVSIGLADSLNPTTIAPALYLATGEASRRRVSEFTVGVFIVYLIGGAAIALGPGQLLLALVPKPGNLARHLVEMVAGVALIVGAAVLWRQRARLAARPLPTLGKQRKSSAILGATITAVELPTAFPYFAVIAAIVGSGLDPIRQLGLLVLFNICFVLPLIAIIVTLTFGGPNADRMLAGGRNFLQRNWPLVLGSLMLVAGVFVTLLGLTALTGGGHTRFGRFMRHVRHVLHP